MSRVTVMKDVLQNLYILWKSHPKLRLGQVITVLNADLKKELYDISDKEFLVQIKRELQKC